MQIQQGELMTDQDICGTGFHISEHGVPGFALNSATKESNGNTAALAQGLQSLEMLLGEKFCGGHHGGLATNFDSAEHG